MSGLFRSSEATVEGKYLVQRRDGTVPDWIWFVLGSRDPAASVALRAYANEADRLGYDPIYVSDIFKLADDFEADFKRLGPGDPDAPRHRADNPEIIAKMRSRRRLGSA